MKADKQGAATAGRRPRAPWPLAVRSVALAALSAVVLGVLVWLGIQARYEQLILADEGAAQRPVAIVFGAGVRPDGRLSPMLRHRMDAAIALYRSGAVRKILVSGDNSTIYYNEPGRMYDYAVAAGVPASDVARDFAGRRTYDTCYRAAEIFGVREAVLVTQRFHLPRALFTCRSFGIDAVGVAADPYEYRSNGFYRFRDAFATVRAWLDVYVLRPLPILGPAIDIGLN
jgi:SanA protein